MKYNSTILTILLCLTLSFFSVFSFATQKYLPNYKNNIDNVEVTALTFSKKNKNLMYAGMNGLYQTLNASLNWQKISDVFANQEITSIVLHPSEIHKIIVTTYVENGRGGGVYQTMNGGKTWNLAQGLPKQMATSFAYNPISPQEAYAVLSFYGVYKTENDGITWKKLTNLPVAFAYQTMNVNSLNPNHLILNLLDRQHYTGQLYQSFNKGETWELINIPNTYLYEVNFSLQNAQTLYVAGKGGIFKTTNAGKSWTNLFQPKNDAIIFSFVINQQAEKNIYAAVENQGLFKTNDGGLSWQNIFVDTELNDKAQIKMDPANKQLFYLSNTKGFFRSTDDGLSWSLVNIG